MLLSTILLCIAVIGSFLWLACILAVFATPLFTGFFVGGWASQAGASLPEAIIVGSIGAALMLCAGRFLLILVRPTWARLSIMTIFVMPAVIAGYHVMHGIVKHIIPSASLQIAFSIMAATVIGVTAFRQFVEISSSPSGPRLLCPDRHSDRDDITETCSETTVVIVGVAAATSVRRISSASATRQASLSRR